MGLSFESSAQRRSSVVALLTRCSRRRRSRWQSGLEQNRCRSELRGSTANNTLHAWHLRCELAIPPASPKPDKRTKKENGRSEQNDFRESFRRRRTRIKRGILDRQIQTKSSARTTGAKHLVQSSGCNCLTPHGRGRLAASWLAQPVAGGYSVLFRPGSPQTGVRLRREYGREGRSASA